MAKVQYFTMVLSTMVKYTAPKYHGIINIMVFWGGIFYHGTKYHGKIYHPETRYYGITKVLIPW